MISPTVIYFAIRVVNGVLALASLYILTRLLSAEQYGSYALGLAGINVAASVLFQWLTAGVARLYAAHTQAPAAFLAEVRRLFLTAAGGGLAALGVWLALRPEGALAALSSLAIGMGAIAMGAYNLHLQIHNASQQPIRYGVLSVSRAALVLSLSAAAVLAGAGAAGALAGVALGCALAVGLFGHRWPRGTAASGAASAARAQIVGYGVPLALTYGSTMVLDVSDRFLIGWWYGAASVSGYAASYDLAQQTVGVFLNVFYLAAFPSITAQWEAGGSTAAKRAAEPLARALLLAAPAAAGVFIGLAPDLAHVMFGPALRIDAARVMPWVAAAIAIGCLKAYLFDAALQLERRTGTQLRITLVMAATNVLLNFILLPALGVVGSAIAAAAAFSLGAMLSFVAGRGADVLPPLRIDLTKALLSLAAMVAALRWAGMLWPVESTGTWLVPVKILIGLLAFTISAMVLDVAGIRTWLSLMVRRK